MPQAMMRYYVVELVGTFGIVFAPAAISGTSIFHGSDSSLVGAFIRAVKP